MNRLNEALQNNGVVLLRMGEHPYSREDVEELTRLSQRMPVVTGIGDTNRVRVGRLIVDPVDVVRDQLGYARATVDAPELAREILNIVAGDAALSWWGEALELSPLTVRRAQVNFLDTGGEVDFHSDHESNPDYRVSVILGLSDDYTGGHFVAEVSPGDIRKARVGRGEVLLARSVLPHAVERVESGSRTSVVLFVA